MQPQPMPWRSPPFNQCRRHCGCHRHCHSFHTLRDSAPAPEPSRSPRSRPRCHGRRSSATTWCSNNSSRCRSGAGAKPGTEVTVKFAGQIKARPRRQRRSVGSALEFVASLQPAGGSGHRGGRNPNVHEHSGRRSLALFRPIEHGKTHRQTTRPEARVQRRAGTGGGRFPGNPRCSRSTKPWPPRRRRISTKPAAGDCAIPIRSKPSNFPPPATFSAGKSMTG